MKYSYLNLISYDNIVNTRQYSCLSHSIHTYILHQLKYKIHSLRLILHANTKAKGNYEWNPMDLDVLFLFFSERYKRAR
jgi:hypothetical protein